MNPAILNSLGRRKLAWNSGSLKEPIAIELRENPREKDLGLKKGIQNNWVQIGGVQQYFGNAIVQQWKLPTNDARNGSYKLTFCVFKYFIIENTRHQQKTTFSMKIKQGNSTLGIRNQRRFENGLFFIIPASLSLPWVISAGVFIYSATSFLIFKLVW